MDVWTTVITKKISSKHKNSCDVTETVEDVQQFWDGQSDGVKYYLSKLGLEHVNTVVSSAARPVVKKKICKGQEIRKVVFLCHD